jgi:glycosyltransferase involved in cell wall biosynthesis
MISTDRLIFHEGSDVRKRQIEYAQDWDEVHIILFEKKDALNLRNGDTSKKGIAISGNCWIYSTNSSLRLFYPVDAKRIGAKIVRERGITHITCQDASLTAMAGVYLKKKFGLDLELQIHNDIGSPYFNFNISNSIRKILAKIYLPQADKIRVVSERIRKYLIEELHIAESKIVVRPINVDIEKIRQSVVIDGADLHKRYPQFEKIILMASRFEPEKDISSAIKAFDIVKKKLPRIGMIIVGSGSEYSHLNNLCSRLGLDKAVIFEPWVDRDRLISYWKTADVFLNTSLFEGYGMTLVEARAAGCPIISTDVGVARETGAVIVGHDIREVVSALESILK